MTPEEFTSLLDRSLDGALTPDETAPFETALATNTVYRQRLETARRLQMRLAGLADLRCPPDVADTVLREIRSRRHSWWHTWAIRPRIGYALAMACVLALMVILQDTPGDSRFHGYTQTEVAQAAYDAQFALALVGRTLTGVSDRVQNDIIPRYMVRPLLRPLQAVSLRNLRKVLP